jgi:AbrB family transcriptional regulator (stage V sporulation protein T)
MKSTGVLRRIDDLGRIVLPKEIRKNLRIRDGEHLEIFIDGDNIILKKHSLIDKISDIAVLCIKAVEDVINAEIIITDRDKVIAASPELREKYLEKEITNDISNIMMQREPKVIFEENKINIINNNKEKGLHYFFPIMNTGDVIGMIIMKSKHNEITDYDKKMISFMGRIISNYIE